MANSTRELGHIVIPHIQSVSDYERRRKRIDKDSLPQPNIPFRTPESHGKKLLSELGAAFDFNNQENLPETALITFRGERGKDFLYDSLDNKTLGIKLLSIKNLEEDGELVTIANVQFLNKKSFEKFSEILKSYEENSLTTKTKKTIIDCTSSIQNSSLENLFFDDIKLFPKEPSEEIWWELVMDGNTIEDSFSDVAYALGIEHDEGGISYLKIEM